MNIIFAGTPDIAATVFKKLLSTEHNIIAAYTQPDRPAGRGQQLMKSPVKQLAEAHNIPVYQPLSLRKPEAQAELAALKPDLMIVVAYGLILPQAVLDIPQFGCWNVHVSLLPRWRGAAPIQRAIAAGDKETGVCIMQMDAGLDTGDILHIVKTPIMPTDTAGSLHDRLAELGADALLETLASLQAGALKATPQQTEGVTYANKLSKEEAKIDWSQKAETIVHQIQAFNPWPVAHSLLHEQTVRLWQAEFKSVCHDKEPGTIVAISKEGVDIAAKAGTVHVKQVQFPGGKVLWVKDVLNAQNHPLQLGSKLQ